MNWKRKGDSLTLLHFIRIQVPITSPPSSAARRRTLSLSLPYRVKSVMSSSRGGAFAGNMWSGGGGGDRLPAYSHPFPGISGLRAGERVGKSVADSAKGGGREQHILKFPSPMSNQMDEEDFLGPHGHYRSNWVEDPHYLFISDARSQNVTYTAGRTYRRPPSCNGSIF